MLSGTQNPNIDYSHDSYPDDRFFDASMKRHSLRKQARLPSSNGSNSDSSSDFHYSNENTNSNFQQLRPPSAGHTKKFSATTEAEFDVFCKTVRMEEHMALLYAVSLEVCDMLKATNKVDVWIIPDSLKKSIAKYSKAFLLSSSITSYHGNCANHVYKAMVDLNINDLPQEKNVSQVAEVLTTISGQLTMFHTQMKQKIQLSLSAPTNSKAPDLRNIADLTHSLILNCPAVPTLQLYMHIMFLWWHLVTYKDGDYWTTVDEMLAHWCKSHTLSQITELFNRLYTKDKMKYGDPVDSNHEPVEPNQILGMLKTLEIHTKNVQPIEERAAIKRKADTLDMDADDD